MDREHHNQLRGKLGLGELKKPTLAGIALLIVMVAATAGHNIANAATATTFSLETPTQTESFTTYEEAAEPDSIYVHICGAVEEPGIYELEEGSRLDDAIRAAGGFADDAATDARNLAQPLVDGTKIAIPTVEEWEREQQAAEDGVGGGLVNLNTASAAQLETLPGIGPATAAKIIADRERNGPYTALGDLTRVAGIGAKKLESLDGLITL